MSPSILRATSQVAPYWLLDEFDEGTTTVLDQHTPDITPAGAAWGTSVGQDNTEFSVVGNSGYVEENATAAAAPWAAYPAKVGPDVRSTLTINFQDSLESNSDRAYLLVRDTSGFTTFSDLYGYFVRINADGTGNLTKGVNGTYTLIDDGGGGFIISPPGSTDHTLTLEVVGTAIRVLWDDTEILSGTDGSITAAGYPRFCNYGLANSQFKRLTIKEL